MYRSGLVLAGLVGGMVMMGGAALAQAPTFAHVPVVMDDNDGLKELRDYGSWNNFGEDNDILDLDLLNELLSRVLSK